jgi:hypothetical protein
MKAAFSAALLFMLLICFIPWGTRTAEISALGQPEFFTRLTSSTPFDFPQQWRKTKRDSDKLIRSDERFNAGMQGITPLWACVYTRDDYTVQDPIIRATDDGGFIVGCIHHPNPTTENQAFIAKLSSNGGVEWYQSYNTYYILDKIKCIEHTDDGGFIVAIRSDMVYHGFLIVKLSAEGSIEWLSSYSGSIGEAPTHIKQTKDGGYIVVGTTTTFTNPDYINPDMGFEVDLLVIKLSSTGSIEWQRAFGGPSFETEWLGKTTSATIIESSHGGYLVVCDTPSFTDIINNPDVRYQQRDIWVVKLSESGDIEWQRVFGGEKNEMLYNPGPHATETTDGKYVVACQTYSYGVVDPNTNSRYSDVWVLKLKSNGDIEWQKTYGGKGGETVHAVLAANKGECILAGASNSWSNSNNSDAWVFKLSPAGKIIWQHTYGGEGWDEASSVCFTKDNGLAIAGITLSFEDEYDDLLVLKLTSNGELDTACSSLFGDSDAVVMDTLAVPFDTYEVARVAGAERLTPKLPIENINLEKRTICWNLNQAPVNIHFERTENKSFFASEAWHTITWSPNPYNSQFSITDYRIYRKDMADKNSSYQLIGTVPANMNIFVDSKGSTGMNENAKYLYVITSVDSEGNESPRSDAVGNLN